MTEDETSRFAGFWRIVRDVLIAGGVASAIGLVGNRLQNLGYEPAANICYFCACLALLCVLPFELFKHNPSFEFGLTVGLVFSQAVVAPLLFVFFYLELKPTPIPYPHFEFRIIKQAGSFEGAIELTNNCFTMEHPPVSIGYLLCPTNFTMKLDLQNLGPPVSENTRITITVPKSFSCDAPGYEYEDEGDSFTLTCHPTDLLSGDSCGLPDIQFRDPPVMRFDQRLNLFTIVARAKDSPAEIVIFDIAFVPVSSQELPAPIVAPTIITNGQSRIPLPPKLSELLFEHNFAQKTP